MANTPTIATTSEILRIGSRRIQICFFQFSNFDLSIFHMHRQSVFTSATPVVLLSCIVLACGSKSGVKSPSDSAGAAASAGASGTDTPKVSGNSTSAAAQSAAPAGAPKLTAADAARTPNELGRIPVAEYHLISDHDALYSRERNHFRKDLEDIYARGYRPVTISQILDRKID